MKINKSHWIIGGLIIVFLVSLLFWLPIEKPKEKRKLDWTPTFKKLENKPYASKAFYALLSDIFPNKELKLRTDVFPNDSLLALQAEAKAKKYNLFYAHLRADADNEFGNALSNFVYFGGKAFIAAEYFSYIFENEFGSVLRTRSINGEKALQIKFLHPKLSEKTYYFPNITYYTTFDVYDWNVYRKKKYDDENTQEVADETPQYEEAMQENDLANQIQVLATDQYDNPIFISIKKGSGTLYVCSVPLIFTNFGILNDEHRDFIAKALSHLPVRDVLWEDEIKWKYKNPPEENPEPEGIKELAFLKKNPPLWWAFWLTLAGVVLFIIFRAKREQRIIPILEKNTNTSLEFTQTIGRLYFNYQDHKNLAEKKILYFLEFLRYTFFISNLNEYPDEATISKIAQKISVDEDKVKQTFEIIQNIKNKNAITETELQQLVSAINQLKKAALVPQNTAL